MNLFQTLLLVFFGFALVIGVLVFAGILPGFKAPVDGVAGKIEVWGVWPEDIMGEIISDINKKYEENFSVTYRSYPEEEINERLIEALATGRGPQAVMLPHEMILKDEKLLTKISQETVSQRQFRDSFIDGASIFAVEEAYLALPLVVDPLIMYYNKDLYTNANLVTVPKTWVEFLGVVPSLTRVKQPNNVIEESAVSLGTFSNIEEAKDIFSLLLLQSGNSVVRRSNGGYQSVLRQDKEENAVLSPASAALQFFVQFSDPTKTAYTWNRSLPQAFEAFVSGLTAHYLAPASRLPSLKAANPHLSFDVAEVPQRDLRSRKVFGRFYGIGVPKAAAKNQYGIQLALILSSSYYQQKISEALDLPSTSRTVLARPSKDPYQTVFNKSAIVSRAWPDSSPEASLEIMRAMTERVYSGQMMVEQAVAAASAELQRALVAN